MQRVLRFPGVLGLFFLTIGVLPAAGQEPARATDGYLEITRLGYSTAVCPGIETREDLQQFFASDPGVVREILAAGGFGGDVDGLFAAVAAGQFTETTFRSGQELMWMGIRRDTGGDATRMVRFTGAAGFEGFALGLTDGNMRYRFAVPKACCNLALIAEHELPAPPAPDPPDIHFATSGEFTHASARITADARLRDDAELEVTLTDPAGSRSVLDMDRDGNRSTWTGQLRDAGEWRAEARLSGSGFAAMSASDSVMVREGPPSCSATLSVSDTAVVHDAAEIVVNTCDSSATTGSLATTYVRIHRDGMPIASLDMSESCERSFILPGGGDYTAEITVTDDRGVVATCEAGAGAMEVHPRAWPIFDLAGGMYSSTREDIADDPTSVMIGGGAGLMLSLQPGMEASTRFFARTAAGVAHNSWFGSVVDFGLIRHTGSGFFGLGAGAWGIGDSDIFDVALFGTGGFDVPIWTRAGKAQIFTELRMFAGEASDIPNNYSGIIGVRFNLTPKHRIVGR